MAAASRRRPWSSNDQPPSVGTYSGVATSAGYELPAGTVLGAYRIVRCIGAGGMGAVYEAEHCELGKRVALKTPFAEAGSSPEGRARFLEEGKTASKLRHPHVVDITDVGEVAGVAYLVMEYLDGEPLGALIKRDGPMPAYLIADILVPVAAALCEARRRGIIHRDLKPDNIFITRSVQGRIYPKILDFGISKVLGDERVPRLTGMEERFAALARVPGAVLGRCCGRWRRAKLSRVLGSRGRPCSPT